MTKPVQIEAVIFDCDGVLVDSEALSLDLEVEFLNRHGLGYERLSFARRFIGTDIHAMDAAVAADCLAMTGQPLGDTVMDEMRAARDALFAENLTAISGARDSLTAWSGAQAIASSTHHPELRRNLSKAGLDDVCYPHVYSAQDVARGKPAPDVFLHAAARIGVSPDKCLVIEDSINGVKAARSAGMTIWGFLGGGHVWPELADQLTEAGAHDLVDHHEDLTARLKRFNDQRFA